MGENGGVRRGVWWPLAGGAFLVVVALLGGCGVVGDGSSGPQQVLLQPVGEPGPDPFTESVAVEEVALQTSVEPTEVTDDEIAVSGNQPGLYGGTQDNASCDANALVSFLEQNPDKGRAWADALDISPDEIRSYVSQLTPLLLRTDTRVTNHGFRDGKATSLQSVLQAGTAVMVDRYGVPRVRCSCGNPLGEPAPLSSSLASGRIDVVGSQWSGWNPSTVLVVNATTEINHFTVFDIDTELTYTVPAGTEVDVDEPPSTETSEDGDAGEVFPSEKGVEIREPDGNTELIEFGARLDDVVTAIEDAIGAPTVDIPPGQAPGQCDRQIYWGNFVVGGVGDVFSAWAFQAQPVVQNEPGPTFQTDRGISIGATRAEVQAAYPEVTIQGTYGAYGTFDTLQFNFTGEGETLGQLLARRDSPPTSC
jgi:hypothetical protein